MFDKMMEESTIQMFKDDFEDFRQTIVSMKKRERKELDKILEGDIPAKASVQVEPEKEVPLESV